MRLGTIATTGAVALLSAAALGQPLSYEFRWLGTNFRPYGVSDNGVVAGDDLTTGMARAAVWEENLGIQVLPFPDPPVGTCMFNFLRGISRDGEVVIGGDGPSCGSDGWLAVWRKSSSGWRLVYLPRGVGFPTEDVTQIGNTYYIVASSTGPAMLKLFRLENFTAEVVFSISVGGYPSALSNTVVVQHVGSNNSEFRDFQGNLLYQIQFPSYSYVVDVSDSGVVLGTSWYQRERTAAVRNLQVPEGAARVEAQDISEDGNRIVGNAIFSDNTTRGVIWLWDRDQGDYVPSYLPPNVKTAVAISANGEYIVGRGINPSTGQEEAYRIKIQECRLPTDIDGNGIVDDADLLQVLFDFGRSCP